MKVLKHVMEGLIGQRVEIDVVQCGFMSCHGTTDAILLNVSYRRSTWLLTRPSSTGPGKSS